MTLRSRRPIASVQGDERRQLLAAFERLFDSADDGANYAFWASIHTSCCEHASALFLPWHRAYIFAFEEALRRAVGDDGLTLPYWDWCTTPALPSLLTELDARIKPPNKKPERYTDKQRLICGAPPLPQQSEVDTALLPDAFMDFGGSLCAPDFKGTLESVHGAPHFWVGPWMASASYAAFDPIFWFHHANVDRLWALWQTRHPGEHPPCATLPLRGIPGRWRVGDVLTILSPRLGYEYADVALVSTDHRGIDSGIAIDIEVPPTGRVEVRLRGVHAMADGPGPAALVAYVGDRPAGRYSLFGLVDGCPASNPPVAVTMPECDGRDHPHKMMSVRFDLTPFVAGHRGSRLTVVIHAEGGSPEARSSLMVSSISVATLPV